MQCSTIHVHVWWYRPIWGDFRRFVGVQHGNQVMEQCEFGQKFTEIVTFQSNSYIHQSKIQNSGCLQ